MIKDYLMWNNCKNKNGYSFIESMIGIAVLSVGILAVLSVTTKMIIGQDYVRDKEIAILLSNEGLEVLKLKINKNKVQCDSTADNLRQNWNCWSDDILVDGKCECGDNVFSQNNNYSADYNGKNWTINLTTADSWQAIYYNCDNNSCYYSHDKKNSDSLETKVKRKISIIKSEDYDDDYYSDMIKIVSSVSWLDRGEEKKVEVVSEIYN